MDLPDEPRCPNHPPPRPTLRPVDDRRLTARPAAEFELVEAGPVRDRVLAAGWVVCRVGCRMVRKPAHAQTRRSRTRQDPAALLSETLRRLKLVPSIIALRFRIA
jgi:hypothetical protein